MLKVHIALLTIIFLFNYIAEPPPLPEYSNHVQESNQEGHEDRSKRNLDGSSLYIDDYNDAGLEEYAVEPGSEGGRRIQDRSLDLDYSAESLQQLPLELRDERQAYSKDSDDTEDSKDDGATVEGLGNSILEGRVEGGLETAIEVSPLDEDNEAATQLLQEEAQADSPDDRAKVALELGQHLLKFYRCEASSYI